MILSDLTHEKIAEMKRLYEAYRTVLCPNRKTGAEVDEYLRNKYPCLPYADRAFRNIVAADIMENEHFRAKLQDDTHTDIRSYRIGDILIGIDLISGEFHIEAEDMANAAHIYDDLFVFRGLDEDDLKNFVLVGEYVRLTLNDRGESCSGG